MKNLKRLIGEILRSRNKKHSFLICFWQNFREFLWNCPVCYFSDSKLLQTNSKVVLFILVANCFSWQWSTRRTTAPCCMVTVFISLLGLELRDNETWRIKLSGAHNKNRDLMQALSCYVIRSSSCKTFIWNVPFICEAKFNAHLSSHFASLYFWISVVLFIIPPSFTIPWK